MLRAGARAATRIRARPSVTQAAPLPRPLPPRVRFSHSEPEGDRTQPPVAVVFVRRDGSEKRVDAYVGENLLRLAQRNDVELEGACECSVACSTCHVVLEPDVYAKLPDAGEDEEDMLDMAFGLTGTSRLGCQVKVERHMDGKRVTLPKATRNFYVDGHKPKPH